MRKFAAELFAVHLYEVIAFLCLLAPLLSLLICVIFVLQDLKKFPMLKNVEQGANLNYYHLALI